MYDEAKDSQLIATAKKKDHILQQWTFLRNHIPSLDEKIQTVMFRLVGRAAIAGNGQTGCERANSTYNLFKTKLSSTMALEMVRARLRVSLNGPPLSMFNPVPIRKVWIEKGHEFAETKSGKRLVLNRIHEEDRQKYTSKIFD